jgi:hypothetical protein
MGQSGQAPAGGQVDTGGKIRSHKILRHPARRHEVTLLSFHGERER